MKINLSADSELLLLLANSTQTLRITWTSDEDDEDGDGHAYEQVVDLVDQEEGVDRLELGFFGHPKQEHVDAEKNWSLFIWFVVLWKT